MDFFNEEFVETSLRVIDDPLSDCLASAHSVVGTH